MAVSHYRSQPVLENGAVRCRARAAARADAAFDGNPDDAEQKQIEWHFYGLWSSTSSTHYCSDGWLSMRANRPSELTLGYCDAHAEEFCRRTRDVEMEALYAPFLALLPAGAHILDAGSGSGRDTLAFLRKGYEVTAFDGSVELAKRASAWTGNAVLHRTFAKIEWSQTFDGVWACASLLHLPRPQVADAICRLTEALLTSPHKRRQAKLEQNEASDGSPGKNEP
jgi:hypothetical protein